CYIGGLDARDTNGRMIKDTRTPAQKASLVKLIKELKAKYPTIKRVIGHRDTSPDRNGNGIIEPFEFIKGCPCFDAEPEYKHLVA
ncbi:MAG: N-acetylmuramoyl-L-alanine amidase, partial [Muribaculaceae bacterium]|nr:N-acetylmuramoyl-L-alanine amidase [Muribaculaceae bacterium]